MTTYRKHVPGTNTVNLEGASCEADACGALETSNSAPKVRLDSTITCPQCESLTPVRMPTDACQYFWECPACGALLKPHPGDCCVFCSFGDVPCPPMQLGRSCGA